MSANCIFCVRNPRTGPDLMCDECRAITKFAAYADPGVCQYCLQTHSEESECKCCKCGTPMHPEFLRNVIEDNKPIVLCPLCDENRRWFAKLQELQSRLESKDMLIKTLEQSRERLLEACKEAQDLITKTQLEVDDSIAHLPRIKALSMALKDAISTYGPKSEILVTAERQETWQNVLDTHGVTNDA